MVRLVTSGSRTGVTNMSGPSMYTYISDDGVSFDYQKGKRSRLQVRATVGPDRELAIDTTKGTIPGENTFPPHSRQSRPLFVHANNHSFDRNESVRVSFWEIF